MLLVHLNQIDVEDVRNLSDKPEEFLPNLATGGLETESSSDGKRA